MESTFKDLSEETQKVYAEIVKTNLSAMSGIMVLMMNQSNALAKGDMNLASSAVVQSMLVAIEKLLQSLLKGDDYLMSMKMCGDFFIKQAVDMVFDKAAADKKAKEEANDSNG